MDPCNRSQTALFCWAVILGIAQILGLSDYKPIAYPVGALIFISALLFYATNFALERIFMANRFGIYSVGLLAITFIPLLCAKVLRKSVISRNLLEEGRE